MGINLFCAGFSSGVAVICLMTGNLFGALLNAAIVVLNLLVAYFNAD